jgi:hypothetical protein
LPYWRKTLEQRAASPLVKSEKQECGVVEAKFQKSINVDQYRTANPDPLDIISKDAVPQSGY